MVKKVERHIYLDEEYYALVMNYCNKNGVTFSKAINEIIEKANFYDEFLVRLNSIQNDNKFILKKLNILYFLVEQMYSDFDFTNITDVTKSKALKEFKNKLNRGRLND